MSSVDPRQGLTIERATAMDAADLSRAASAMFEQAFGDANTEDDMAAYCAQAFADAQLRSDLADERNLIWMARETLGGPIIGYAHIRLDAAPAQGSRAEKYAEISRLYTDRVWHGRGLGSMLMKTCIVAAREADIDVLWLGVWEHNARAIAFYEKHGFATIGEQAFTLGSDRQRDLVMALDLTRKS